MQQRKQRVILQEFVPCCKDKHSIFICTSEHCKQTAFICNDGTCDCIRKSHYKCSSNVTQYFLQSIQQHKKSISGENIAAFETIIKIYEDLIQKISKQKEQFITFTQMYGLGQNMRKFVSLINQGRSNQIDGNLSYKVKIQINQLEASTKNMIDENGIKKKWIEQQKKMDKILQQLANYRKLDKSKILFDSKILDADNQILIQQFLQNDVKQVELLYRGSQNGYSSSKFHQKCDGVGNTLVIVQTDSGMILGGFTPAKWQTSSQMKYAADSSGKSFLFEIGKLKQKFPIKSSQLGHAVRFQSEYGPMFGMGCDLFISNACNVSSSGVFLSTYQDKNNKFNYKTGGNTHYFKVKQYEVYKIIK